MRTAESRYVADELTSSIRAAFVIAPLSGRLVTLRNATTE